MIILDVFTRILEQKKLFRENRVFFFWFFLKKIFFRAFPESAYLFLWLGKENISFSEEV